MGFIGRIKDISEGIVRELEISVDSLNKGSNHPGGWNKRNMAR